MVAKEKASDSSMSLDRINNNIGYEPDNIQIICNRANTIKGNATLKELKQLVLWMENIC